MALARGQQHLPAWAKDEGGSGGWEGGAGRHKSDSGESLSGWSEVEKLIRLYMQQVWYGLWLDEMQSKRERSLGTGSPTTPHAAGPGHIPHFRSNRYLATIWPPQQRPYGNHSSKAVLHGALSSPMLGYQMYLGLAWVSPPSQHTASSPTLHFTLSSAGGAGPRGGGAQAGLKALYTCMSWDAYAAMSSSSTRSLV